MKKYKDEQMERLIMKKDDSWFSKKFWILIGVIILLFVINIIFSILTSCLNNLFTAISGWISFFATAGVGAITVYQGRKYSDSSQKTMDEMKKYVDSIDDSIWRNSIPIVGADCSKGVEIHFDTKKVEIFNRRLPKIEGKIESEQICFKLCKKADLTMKSHIESNASITFTIKNESETPIQEIQCEKVILALKKGEEERNNPVVVENYSIEITKYYEFVDTYQIIQGFIEPKSSKLCVLYFIGTILPEDFPDNYFHISIYLKIKDHRSYRQIKQTDIFGSLSKSEKGVLVNNPRIINCDVKKVIDKEI